jgi:hypothetical protein
VLTVDLLRPQAYSWGMPQLLVEAPWSDRSAFGNAQCLDCRYDIDRFDLRTGPATHQKPPQMGPGDRILFHAVIHVRLFAEGEILGTPHWTKDPEWGLRWPWVYPCRVDVWVPLIKQGLLSSEVVPERAFKRIQAGGEYAKLSAIEYEELLDALLAQPNAHKRSSRAPSQTKAIHCRRHRSSADPGDTLWA